MGLIYSNVFVAFVLGLLTFASYFQVNYINFHWYVPVSVFLGSFILYSFHRLYKIDFIPKSQLSQRHPGILAHATKMKIAMSFAVFLLLLLLPFYEADTIVWLVPAGIVSVGYTIPILPTKQGWSRFRDIPLTKPLIISIVVTYLTFFFPVFEQTNWNELFTGPVFSAWSERLLFLLAVTIPFDLRDVVNDKDAGIETLATQFGFVRSRQLATVALFAWLTLIGIRTVRFDLLWWSGLPFLLVGIYAGYAFFRLDAQWSDVKYTLVFEGAIVAYSAAVLASSLIHSVA